MQALSIFTFSQVCDTESAAKAGHIRGSVIGSADFPSPWPSLPNAAPTEAASSHITGEESPAPLQEAQFIASLRTASQQRS